MFTISPYFWTSKSPCLGLAALWMFCGRQLAVSNVDDQTFLIAAIRI